ncbi:GH92 family glycosyl hydrolase [Streptomyces sp. NPDC059740]|uniref:GH92 family glycosyl hydrolase n=1 Tax=Streptomyces sp. NPDC059740 TaxID=3346926 RepID=UPI00365B0C81
MAGLVLLAAQDPSATASPEHLGSHPAHAVFDSSFEAGDPSPTWSGSAERGPDGEPQVLGVQPQEEGGPERSGMTTEVDTGPDTTLNSRDGAGFSGRRALLYGGSHTTRGRGYAHNRVFDVDVPVTPRTVLSYRLYPAMAEEDLTYPATHVAVDLAFTDGTYLSELGAVDQHGVALTPRAQGASKTLYADQWNHRESAIGAVAAGRTVDRVLLSYDAPSGPADFHGWLDDLRIAPQAPQPRPAHLADYAVTTRGTLSSGGFSRGNTFPATAVPGGFNFWTPVTNAASSNWLYEYARRNNKDNLPTIQAFSASHEPSPWMGDRQTFQVMPSTAHGPPDASRKGRALAFHHERETARPHYYGVRFDNGLKAEIAPSDHAAMMRFTFPGRDANLVFDNVNNSGGVEFDAAHGVVTGYSDVRSSLSVGATRLFVYGVVDRPVTAEGRLTGGGGPDVTGYAKVRPARDGTVTLRLATSLIGVDQARANLNREIPAGTTFSQVRDRARAQWDDLLGRIEVEGATHDQLVTLYSSLYRLYLYPNSGSERVGRRERYASPFSEPLRADTPTHTGARVVDGRIYVNNGFWDTYRTTWPAYALLTPRRAGRMADGFVQQYRDGGWISRWSSPGYADLMTGTSSDVAFADAYAKGVHFDAAAAYEAALKNATVAPPESGVGRKGMATAPFLGYTTTGTGEGMSWALEGYLNDAGISRMGRALYERTHKRRYKEESDYFRNRALEYVHLFDRRVGFFQGRDAEGNWRRDADTYDPRVWGYDYTETNGWTYAFAVPQDTRGLANLYGGRAGLARKLDTYFATPETATEDVAGSYGTVIHEMTEARDVRMGQYGHNNQPSHHIAYLYDAAGQPWKTQAKVREATRRLYLGSEIGQGYPGDEDNGEMSAWYVFSALGFYPLVMGAPEYAVGSPLFTKATVHLESGRDLVISAPHNSARNVYVQGLRVNGRPWNSTRLPHEVVARGGRLEFAMGPRPSRWGTGREDGPTSLTRGSAPPRPAGDLASPGEDTPAALTDDTSASFAHLESVDLDVPTGREVTSYTLTSALHEEVPRAWRLEASDDGEEWTVVDRRSAERFDWDQQTRPFEIRHPGRYLHYRLVVEGAGPPGEDREATLAEIELLG